MSKIQNNRRGKWREDFKIIIKSLEEGPKTQAQLAGELGEIEARIPEALMKRVYRCLKQLEEWGLIKKGEDRRWYWYMHVRAFNSWGEYEAWRSHSEQLLDALEGLYKLRSHIEAERQRLGDSGSVVSIDPTPLVGLELLYCAEEHLRTGYPDTYKLLIEYGSKDKELQGVEKRLLKELRAKFEKRFGDLIDHAGRSKRERYVGDNIPEAICKRMRARLLDYPMPVLCIDDEGKVCCGDIVMGRGGDIFEKIKEFVEVEEEDNIEAYEKVIEIKKVMEEVLFNLGAEIRELTMETKHGTPLYGECKLCPKLKINE